MLLVGRQATFQRIVPLELAFPWVAPPLTIQRVGLCWAAGRWWDVLGRTGLYCTEVWLCWVVMEWVGLGGGCGVMGSVGLGYDWLRWIDRGWSGPGWAVLGCDGLD